MTYSTVFQELLLFLLLCSSTSSIHDFHGLLMQSLSYPLSLSGSPPEMLSGTFLSTTHCCSASRSIRQPSARCTPHCSTASLALHRCASVCVCVCLTLQCCLSRHSGCVAGGPCCKQTTRPSHSGSPTARLLVRLSSGSGMASPGSTSGSKRNSCKWHISFFHC